MNLLGILRDRNIFEGLCAFACVHAFPSNPEKQNPPLLSQLFNSLSLSLSLCLSLSLLPPSFSSLCCGLRPWILIKPPKGKRWVRPEGIYLSPVVYCLQ
jgi:hypothetical protein